MMKASRLPRRHPNSQARRPPLLLSRQLPKPSPSPGPRIFPPQVRVLPHIHFFAVGTPVPLPTAIPGMRRQELNAGLLADRDVPDLSSLNMSEIVEIITRNDYRIALAETGEPSELAAEPNLSAPPKKKAASKPKSAPAVSPTAVAAKPKAAPAKAAPKRKTPPAADAEEHPSKRVPVEAAPPPKAAAAKKNGAKPKAHPSATPDQGVAKQSTETPELIDFPVTFSNLEIAEGFLRKIGLDPKLKKFVAQVEEEHQKCMSDHQGQCSMEFHR